MAQSTTSYVLRIYRRKRAGQEITGILEIPEQDARLAFRSFDELKHLLAGADASGPSGPRKERGGKQ